MLTRNLQRVYGLSCSPAALSRLLQIQRRGISSKSVTEDALRRFALSLDRQTAAFKRRRFGKQPLAKPVDFDGALRRLVQAACLASFFGPSLPADAMRSDLSTFTVAISTLAATPSPLQSWTLSGACKARDALVATVVSWLNTSAPEIEAVETINELRAASIADSVSTTDLARMLLALIVTLTSHAPGTLSWAMLHVVQAGPDLVATLRDEASTLFWTAADEEGIDVTAATVDAGFAMPMTTDVVLETVRLFTCSYIHRTVEVDTVVFHRPGERSTTERRKLGSRSVSFSDTPSRTPSPANLSRTSSGSAVPPALKQSYSPPRPVKQEPIPLKAGTRVVLCRRPAQLSEECWGSDARVWRPGRWEEDSGPGADFGPWGGSVATVRFSVFGLTRGDLTRIRPVRSPPARPCPAQDCARPPHPQL